MRSKPTDTTEKGAPKLSMKQLAALLKPVADKADFDRREPRRNALRATWPRAARSVDWGTSIDPRLQTGNRRIHSPGSSVRGFGRRWRGSGFSTAPPRGQGGALEMTAPCCRPTGTGDSSRSGACGFRDLPFERAMLKNRPQGLFFNTADVNGFCVLPYSL